MAYYLNKDNNGDLASILTGAYNISSPTASGNMTPVPQRKQQCQGNEDCAAGQRCLDGQCVASNTCQTSAQCGSGYICVNGKCQPQGYCISSADCPGGQTCINHRCTKARCTTRADCPAGYNCIGGECVVVEASCRTDAQCPPGEKCVNGVCQKVSVCNPPCVPPAVCINNKCQTPSKEDCRKTGCPTGYKCSCATGKDPVTGKDMETCTCVKTGEKGDCVPGKSCTGPERNNPQCGGAKCFRPDFKGDESERGKCYCKGGDGDGDGGTTTGTLGEWGYPADMQELMALLLSRGKELLGMPTGYSQEAQEKMFGTEFENIRDTEGGQREALTNVLQRQGMLGTGAGTGLLNQLAWGTEGNVADLARDLFIKNELQKRADLIDYTSLANTLMGTGMGYESLMESINSARRGEGSNALSLLLSWFNAMTA